MISKKVDCSSLLDELRDISYNYYMNTKGEVIDKDGNVQDDEHINIKTKFYILYCMAYKALDEMNKQESLSKIDRQFIDRALTTYGMFDYFINVCIAEYRIYDEIGTGIVTYLPYKPLADFFFENNARKMILFNYLKSEILSLEEENSKRRVK